MINALDLFSGIGGNTLALRDWVKTVAYCEADRHAQAVLLSRMSDGSIDRAPIFNDVSMLSKDAIDDMLHFQMEDNHMVGKLKKLTQEQVDDAVIKYNSGSSLADLGHLYGVSRQSMHDLLKRRTTMRTQKRYSDDNHFYRGGKRADERAHNIVDKAIQSGKLVNPQRCETCDVSGRFKDGRTAIQAHHDDYNLPLSVRWLCQPCHHEWHKNNTPVKLREGGEEGSTSIDIIVGGFP